MPKNHINDKTCHNIRENMHHKQVERSLSHKVTEQTWQVVYNILDRASTGRTGRGIRALFIDPNQE